MLVGIYEAIKTTKTDAWNVLGKVTILRIGAHALHCPRVRISYIHSRQLQHIRSR
jgi:hypothetical protein